jgi:NAD(P)-dependent dehydrogenase (short-subunit alcohol dehydrogenase family)
VIALIIGGTTGIGRELAIYAHEENIATPIITGRSAVTMDDAPVGMCRVNLDLENPGSIDACVRELPQRIDYICWVAGQFLRKPFADTCRDEVDRMLDIHLRGPLVLLQALHANAVRQTRIGRPSKYHLIVVSSAAAWKCRSNQAIYSMVKSAQSHFARSFATELGRDLPGSRVSVAHPGGVNTPTFWRGTVQKLDGFLSPRDVAVAIWGRALSQHDIYDEYHLLRSRGGELRVEAGPMLPILPQVT